MSERNEEDLGSGGDPGETNDPDEPTAGPVSPPPGWSDWQELTPAEWRVVELVRKGWMNSDVGKELGISGKTVGHHLGKVYRKLGLKSRIELILAKPPNRQDRLPRSRTKPQNHQG